MTSIHTLWSELRLIAAVAALKLAKVLTPEEPRCYRILTAIDDAINIIAETP